MTNPMRTILLAATTLALGACGPEILREEPFPGALRQGQTVLVDDGRCPAGQVSQIEGGRLGAGSVGARTRTCVPRPTGR